MDIDLSMITLPIRDAWEALTSETDRIIGFFVIPLIIVVVITAAQYEMVINPEGTLFLSLLAKTNACTTSIIPYTVFSLVYQNGIYAYCQAASFNPMILAAWYFQILAILFVAIVVFEGIWHFG